MTAPNPTAAVIEAARALLHDYERAVDGVLLAMSINQLRQALLAYIQQRPSGKPLKPIDMQVFDHPSEYRVILQAGGEVLGALDDDFFPKRDVRRYAELICEASKNWTVAK